MSSRPSSLFLLALLGLLFVGTCNCAGSAAKRAGTLTLIAPYDPGTAGGG